MKLTILLLFIFPLTTFTQDWSKSGNILSPTSLDDSVAIGTAVGIKKFTINGDLLVSSNSINWNDYPVVDLFVAGGGNTGRYGFSIANSLEQGGVKASFTFDRNELCTKFLSGVQPGGENDIMKFLSYVDGTEYDFFTIDSRQNLKFKSSGVETLRLTSQGMLGIGTTNPQSKLSVKGNIESQEVQVKATVADYVFSSEYHRMSLEELEKFIEINSHLPRIQTQKEVDENRGLVKLGELSVSLMEKVEELTLHLIEINNRLKIVEEENRILKEKLN